MKKIKTIFSSAVIAFAVAFINSATMCFFKNYLHLGDPLPISEAVGIGIGTFLPVFIVLFFFLRIGLKFLDGLVKGP